MRYLFRGLIRESGKTVEGAVEADTAEDALNALSSNGIVTEDLTPAPVPIGAYAPSARAGFAPKTAGRAGAPPAPPGEEAPEEGGEGASDYVSAQTVEHPGARSDDAIDRAFAAASQSVSFDAVAQRYKGKSVWVIDRDKIRRQVAVVVDAAIKQVEQQQPQDKAGFDGDSVRQTVADALKELFKDNRNIASQQTPEQARAQQAQQAAPSAGDNGSGGALSAGQMAAFDAQIGRLEQFLGKAETVLTQLQVAARRVGTGGGGGAAGFAPRRMSHIPKPRSDEQNSVLMEIFKTNLKLRENIARRQSDDPSDDAASPDASEPART